MSKDNTPGDLSIRIGFARVFGGGADQGKLRPSLEITDGTSCKTIVIELDPADLAELMSGSAVDVTADRVSGFKALRDFGKYHKMISRTVKTEPGDHKAKTSADMRALPHVAKAIAEIEADGYRCDSPHRNNAGLWVVIGRRCEDRP